MPVLRYEVWDGPDAKGFWLATKEQDEQRSKISPGAELVHVIYATSLLEAMTLYHQWRGWEPYKPVPDFAYRPHTTEDAERQRSEGFS